MKVVSRIIFVAAMTAWGYSIACLWHERRETNVWSLLFLLVMVIAILSVLTRLLVRGKAIKATNRQNLMLLVTAFSVVFLFAEMLLRFFATSLQGHNEANGDRNYHSAYQIFLNPCDSCGGREEYVNQANGEVDISNNEFAYRHKYNGYGLRDRQFTLEKDSHEFRILGLGDSFTEGVGTSPDSTWLKQLEGRLNHPGARHKYTTMNGGAHGSDLIFSYELLTRCLLRYKPDLVILDLNSTDIGDVSRAGGDERFDSAGHFARRHGRWWEFGFGSSYIVRLFALRLFHYDWQMRSPAQQREDDLLSMQRIARKINDFQVLAMREHFRFLLVTQPLPSDLMRTDLYEHLDIPASIQHLNLYPYFKIKIMEEHEPLTKYYWPVDGHYNGYGYGVMAEQIHRDYFGSWAGQREWIENELNAERKTPE